MTIIVTGGAGFIGSNFMSLSVAKILVIQVTSLFFIVSHNSPDKNHKKK